MAEDPGSPSESSSLLQKRAFLHLRRRSDKVWFFGGILSMLFSIYVFVYKLWFEPREAVEVMTGMRVVSEAPASSEAEAPAPKARAAREEEAPSPRGLARRKMEAEEALPAQAPAREKEPAKAVPAPAPKAVRKEAPPLKGNQKHMAELLVPAEVPETPEPSVHVHVPGKEFVPITPALVGWKTIKDSGSTLRLTTEAGASPRSRAIALSYDLGSQGELVQVSVDGAFDFSVGETLSFAYKGDGNRNSLEVKVETTRGEVFGKVLGGATAERNWTVAKLPLSGFHYFWGGSKKVLDPEDIRRIYFAVSKKSGDKGKAGKFLVSDISKIAP